jgi:hypothetical protein
LRLKNTIIDKTLTYASETWTLTKRDRKQLNVFERKVYRKILGKVYDSEIQNWRILTNKEIYASVKKPTIIETIRLNRLRWFEHVQRMEDNRIPKRVLCMCGDTHMTVHHVPLLRTSQNPAPLSITAKCSLTPTISVLLAKRP